jgi:hypothetical protein
MRPQIFLTCLPNANQCPRRSKKRPGVDTGAIFKPNVFPVTLRELTSNSQFREQAIALFCLQPYLPDIAVYYGGSSRSGLTLFLNGIFSLKVPVFSP